MEHVSAAVARYEVSEMAKTQSGSFVSESPEPRTLAIELPPHVRRRVYLLLILLILLAELFINILAVLLPVFIFPTAKGFAKGVSDHNFIY